MITSPVFDRNILAYTGGASLIVNQGGTRSGKTYSIMQLLFLIAYKSKTPLIISVCSYALPHLKLGAMRELESILAGEGIITSDVKNISNSEFRIGKSKIEFFGVDNLGKVHGPARDILYINEANFIKQEIYTQLAIRTKKTVFIDFNPTSEFWYHTEIQNKVNHDLIKSTYLDNSFLTAMQIERIEAKKDNEHWWRVYGLGELGRLEGAILQNWDFGKFDNNLQPIYGLDFGVKDPDALVKVALDQKNKILYWQELLYESNQSTDVLIQKVKARTQFNSLIVCDSAGLRTITDMRAAKLNAQSVVKGQIVSDIKALYDYKIVISENSFNLSRELSSWVWVDKRGEVPLDENNHLIDAARYASMRLIKPVSNVVTRIN